jgi:hypothetical protein
MSRSPSSGRASRSCGRWTPAADPQGGDRRIALLVALLALLVYNANLRTISSGDCYPARFLPMAVLHDGSVYLDHLVEATEMGSQQPYWITRDRGHVASLYPLVTPLLATPLYVPAVLYLDVHGWGDVKAVQVAGEVTEKIAASCIAAASAGLMFWLLRRQMSRPRALLLVTAFALGTETWTISSQALWQHGTAELLIVVALLALTRPPTTGGLLTAGLACGLVVANRPPDAVLAAAFALYVPFWARPLERPFWPRPLARPFWAMPLARSLLFFAAAAVPLALVAGYDLVSFGSLSGGYGYILQVATSPDSFFHYPFWSGLAGELFSPGKGLFVYTPFLLLLPIYLRRTLQPPYRVLAALLAAGIAAQLAIYAKTDWRGGYSYGPRYLTDMVPILVWLLAPVVESLRGASFAAFVAASAFSIYVQIVGSFFYPGAGSDQLYYSGGPPASPDFTNVWKPRDAAFLAEIRSGWRHHLLELWRHGP